MKNLSIIFLVVIISSCANYSFDTNLSFKKTKNYFAISKVDVVTNKEDIDLTKFSFAKNESLLICQKDPNLPEVDRIDVRNQARIQAKNQNYSLIFIKSCNNNIDKKCLSSASCSIDFYLLM